MKDYYKILELEKTASQEEIKKSFRRLSKILHPDKETGDAEKFKELNEAYQILSDKAKKHAYDTGTTYLKPQPPTINDIVIRIKWTLDDIKKGKTIKVPVNRVVVCKTCKGVGSKTTSSITTCSNCNGAGRFVKQEQTPFGYMMMEHMCGSCQGTGEHNSDPCPTCQGEKMVNESIQETVTIPPGVIDHFIQHNAGHKTTHGNSNLVIILNLNDEGVVASPTGLHKPINVDTFEALLGKEQIVTIKDKTLKVNLPKNATNGQTFKLKEAFYGVDVMIHINVPLPTLEQTKKFILDIFKDESEILPAVMERVNKVFR